MATITYAETKRSSARVFMKCEEDGMYHIIGSTTASGVLNFNITTEEKPNITEDQPKSINKKGAWTMDVAAEFDLDDIVHRELFRDTLEQEVNKERDIITLWTFAHDATDPKKILGNYFKTKTILKDMGGDGGDNPLATNFTLTSQGDVIKGFVDFTDDTEVEIVAGKIRAFPSTLFEESDLKTWKFEEKA